MRAAAAGSEQPYQPVALAVERLDSAPALLVLDGGRPCTVVARADLLAFLSQKSRGGAAS